ncbi:YscO family type III secretion system apparatus protein [Labrys sp. La1]|uniref:type III secretion system stalk subunit SctO n=1 Tax=Labrys sp. La1 TaxID=3404917 RepID=UPI003EBD4472
MARQAVISQLHKIRSLRERRALEAVVRRQRLAREAQDQAQSAATALDTRLERAAADERASFADLMRQALTAQDLLRLRGRFQLTASEVEQLRQATEEARQAETEQQQKLAQAREDHHARRKAIEKLTRLVDDLRSRSVRRQEAIEEMMIEEEATLAGASKPRPVRA